MAEIKMSLREPTPTDSSIRRSYRFVDPEGYKIAKISAVLDQACRTCPMEGVCSPSKRVSFADSKEIIFSATRSTDPSCRIPKDPDNSLSIDTDMAVDPKNYTALTMLLTERY